MEEPVASASFARQTPPNNDHSNPQQGTGAAVKTNNGKEVTKYPSTNSETPATTMSTTVPNNHNRHHNNHAEDKRKLFVGGLPTDITQPEFEEFFSQFGELQKAVVMFDRETGRSRGFGFVTYVDLEISKSLLQMGDHEDGVGRIVMRGNKTCEVKPATPKGQAASSRGEGKARNRSSGHRNPHKASAYPGPPFFYNEHSPMMYSQEGYFSAHDVSGYPMTMYHPAMAPPVSHDPQPEQRGIVSNADQDSRGGGGGTDGSPYFFAPNAYPPAYNLPTTNLPQQQQQPYAFMPVVPTPHHQAVSVSQPVTVTQPVTQQPVAHPISVMHPVEPGIPMAEEE